MGRIISFIRDAMLKKNSRRGRKWTTPLLVASILGLLLIKINITYNGPFYESLLGESFQKDKEKASFISKDLTFKDFSKLKLQGRWHSKIVQSSK